MRRFERFATLWPSKCERLGLFEGNRERGLTISLKFIGRSRPFLVEMHKTQSTEMPTDQWHTRTLLITGIESSAAHPKIKAELEKYGDVKETYTIKNSQKFMFAIFYDIRHAQKAQGNMDGMNIDGSTIDVTYTVSKYEIPREGDRCDETKNQGTLLLVTRDLSQPITEQEVRDMFSDDGGIKVVRDYKAFQKFIEFYDCRKACEVYKNFNETDYKNGKIMLRFVWDYALRVRCDMIKQTDAILQRLQSTDKRRGSDENAKKKKIGEPKAKGTQKSVFYRALDDFIAENISEISRMVK
jgi:RNA recognition motif-containing protein